MASVSVPTLQIPPAPRTLRRWRGLPTVPPLLVAFAVVYPWIANDYWTFNLTYAFTFAIGCLGLFVATGWAGQISLAQAGLVGTALYLTGYLELSSEPFDSPGLPFFLAIGVGVAVVVVLSLLVAVISVRLGVVYTLVLTFALQSAIEAKAFTDERLVPGMAEYVYPRPTPLGMNLYNDSRYYWFVLVVLVAVLGFLYRLRRSRFGRALIAAGANPEAASTYGVSPWLYRVAALCIAGALAGVAGGLEAPLFRTPPGSLLFYGFSSPVYLAAPILAGCESATAVVVAAVVVQVLPQMLLDWRLNNVLVAGVAMLLGLLLGPRGLAGRLGDLVDGRGRMAGCSRSIPTRSGCAPGSVG